MYKFLMSIKVIIIIALIQTFSYAETELICKPTEQNNYKDAPWLCPDLTNDNTLNAELADVDVRTGNYECKYFYKANKRWATACHYVSKNYKYDLKDKFKEVSTLLENNQTVDFKTDYHWALVSLETNETKELSDKVDDLSAIATETMQKLKLFEDTIASKLNTFFKVNRTMAQIQANSYKHLVKPYVTSGVIKGAEKEDTFSRFVTGMVVLDSAVVEGYDESTGDLQTTSKWESKPSVTIDTIAILKTLKNYYNGEKKKNNTDILKFNFDPSDWADIFKMKIWGFYYNLQRRLDIGYDILATQLLFLMMAFFAMTATARGGARYITNRESGGSSGEVKINEASIMKTLGILATVFVFFISVPTPYNNTYNTVTQKADVKFEMRTNNSLGKQFIRYAIAQGSYFGTMMADLGTDAFLEYVVKKQGLYSGLFEKINFKDALKEMVYYYPSLQINNECAKQQLSPLGSLRSDSKASQTGINPTYTPSKEIFLRAHKITRISPLLCSKVSQDVTTTLEALSNKIYTTLDKIENVNVIRAKATENIVRNHIALQEDIGWMNILSVPYTYFMMKYQELFFEETLDFKSLEEKTRAYVDNLGLRDGDDVLDSTWQANTDRSRGRLVNSQELAEQNRKLMRYAFYNFLPQFSQIKNEVSQRLQGLYSDILRLRRTGTDSTYDKYMGKYENLLRSLFKNANDSYKGPISQKEMDALINKIRTDPIAQAQTVQFVSYTVAMATWKKGFIIVFLSAIAMIIGFKIVLYVIDVLIHFFVAPFIVVWAFTSGDGGGHKIRNYLRDTLVYMLYPTIIVIGVFIFIFAYELFHTLYGFIINVLIEGQLNVVSNAIAGKPSGALSQDAMSYLSLYSLRDMTELFIDLLSVYIAFEIIYKFPEKVLKMLGLGESTALMMVQSTEKLSGKGGGSVNPLSR